MRGKQLPRKERLRGKDAIQKIVEEGKSIETSLLVIRFLPTDGERSDRRVVVAVSRQMKGSVNRNLLKRRVREIYRQNREALPQWGDFLIIAKASAQDATYTDLAESFKALASKLAD